MVPGRRIAAGQLRLFKTPRISELPGGEHHCLGYRCRRLATIGERRLGEPHHGVMIDLASHHQGQPRVAIARRQPTMQIIDSQPIKARLAAQDRPPQRLAGKRRFLQIVENDVVGRIARLAELLQHHILFAYQIIGIEARVGDQIGDDRHTQRQIARQQPGVEHRGVAAGPGVEIAADVLDLLGDGAGAARCGALEHHMLEQMRQPIVLRRFIARADVGMERNGNGFHPGRGTSRNAQAVRGVGDDGQFHAGCALAAINASISPRSAGNTV